MEEIPAPGDRTTRMTYYWEGGHFKKALGDRMIERLFTGVGEFGVDLDLQNIEARVVEDRKRVQSLVATPSPLSGEVERIVARETKSRALRQGGSRE
jgi:hypothetical protein